MTDVIKYTLKSPVNLSSGATLTEVTMREPEVGDMIAAEQAGGGDTAGVARLLAR
ncbi:MAG: phage tail assembly protein, partial [Stutzerimonas stutzeri]